MHIDKKSPIPAYFQLKNIILQKIDAGEYSKGNPIPSERELSETLNISRMTVRQALNQLVTDGVLYREKGKGTFVTKSKFEQRNVMSFSDIVKRKGLVPSTRVLHFGRMEAGSELAELLEIKTGQPLYHIRRLRLADSKPIGIEEVFIPELYCPGLEKHDLTSSLYKLIREEYSHAISYVDNEIEADKPCKEERDLLESGTGMLLLRISGTSYTETGLRLLYERSAYRSDEYKYNIRFYVNKDME